MKVKAVLFDAAETLFTTRGSVGEIYGSIAREYGSRAPADKIQAAFVGNFRGAGPISVENQKLWWKDIVHRVFTEVGMVDNFDEFFDRVYDTFRDSEGWLLYPETRQVLSQLRQHGYKLGVISNFDTRIYSVMESLAILEFFHSVTTSVEAGYCKPAPEIFHAAISALKVEPTEALIVGDNLRDDIEAGIQAGLQGILVDRADRYPGTLTPRISSLKELIPLLISYA